MVKGAKAGIMVGWTANVVVSQFDESTSIALSRSDFFGELACVARDRAFLALDGFLSALTLFLFASEGACVPPTSVGVSRLDLVGDLASATPDKVFCWPALFLILALFFFFLFGLISISFFEDNYFVVDFGLAAALAPDGVFFGGIMGKSRD